MNSRVVAVLNGPNLNRLGLREPHVYGHTTLAEVEKRLVAEGRSFGVEVRCFQSNHEGELIDRIHALADEGVRDCIFNPGGFTHTSVALRDALAGVGIRVVEVHISNIHKREEFRHHSYISGVAQGVIAGLGTEGYSLALRYLAAQPAQP